MEIPSIGSLEQVPQAVAAFRQTGVLIVRDVVPAETVDRIRARFEPLFKGEFDTGIYPDEWYWRHGLSLSEATRHMSNAWKADFTIGEFVRHYGLAKAAAELMDWPGVRLGQDTLWWKVPGSKAAAFHQDASFVDFLDPPLMLTCWVALDDTQAGFGTLEYALGSHQWPITERPLDFHDPMNGYRSRMLAAAAEKQPVVQPLQMGAGSVVFHHGHTWHGSESNPSVARSRRSIALHYLPRNARFATERGGYTYGRYKLPGSDKLEDCFFPPVGEAA